MPLKLNIYEGSSLTLCRFGWLKDCKYTYFSTASDNYPAKYAECRDDETSNESLAHNNGKCFNTQ